MHEIISFQYAVLRTMARTDPNIRPCPLCVQCRTTEKPENPRQISHSHSVPCISIGV